MNDGITIPHADEQSPVSHWFSAAMITTCVTMAAAFTLILDGPPQLILPLSLTIPVTVAVLDIRARRRWSQARSEACGMVRPTVRHVLRQMRIRNEDAAVDVYERAAIGVVGLVISLAFLAAVDGPERFVAAALFLLFPVIPIAAGINVDYIDARNDLTSSPEKGSSA